MPGALRCFASILVCVFALLFCPGRSLAISLDDALRAVDQCASRVNSARDELNRAKDALGRAQGAVRDRQRDLDNASRAVAGSMNQVNVAHEALNQAQRALGEAAAKVGDATNRLNVQKALEARLKSVVDNLLASQVVLFDMQWTIRAEYNVNAGSFNCAAEMPNLLRMTSGQINAAFKGNVTLPEVSLPDLFAASMGLATTRQCDFDDQVTKLYQEAGPNARVYVSGRNLAEVLSPEHAADETAKGVLSLGTTVSGSVEEIADSFLQELTQVNAFLQTVGGDNADRMFEAVAQAIVLGKPLESTDFPQLKVKMFKGSMTYTVGVAGQSELLKYFPELKTNDVSINKTFTFPRLGFAVVVEGGPKPSLADLKARIGTGKALSKELLQRILPKEVYPVLEPALASGGDPGALLSASLAAAFRDVDYTHFALAASGEPVIDLRATPIGEQLIKLISKLKIGHQGTADVTRLTLDIQTGQVVIVCTMRAREEMSLAEALKVVGKSVEGIKDTAVQQWHAAIAETAQLQHQWAEAISKAQAAASVVGRSSESLAHLQAILVGDQHAQALANQGLVAARGAESSARDLVNSANHRLQDAEDALNRAKKVVDEIRHPHLPPIHNPIPIRPPNHWHF